MACDAEMKTHLLLNRVSFKQIKYIIENIIVIYLLALILFIKPHLRARFIEMVFKVTCDIIHIYLIANCNVSLIIFYSCNKLQEREKSFQLSK